MTIKELRDFLTDRVRQKTDFRSTDQNTGVPTPPIEKSITEDAVVTPLPDFSTLTEKSTKTLVELIGSRRSWRHFNTNPLTLQALSFLLWATQGVKHLAKNGVVLRNVPSAGNRHSFETYLCVQNVEGLSAGIYRYLPLEHALVFEYTPDNFAMQITEAALGQSFVAKAPVLFVWTSIPYRMEWRYGKASHKVIAVDAGHVCQNLYLAAGSINCGTCAIAAYNQDMADALVRVDGEDEMVVYMAPVGYV